MEAGENLTFNPRQSRILSQFAETLLPEGGPIPLGATEAQVVKVADYFLVPFDPVALKFLKVFLYVFEYLPAPTLRKFRPFTRLSSEDRKRYLERWEFSRIYLRRVIFASLKALCSWAYFSHPEVDKVLGYEPRCLKE